MNPLQFVRVNGPKQENQILFHFGGNPFDLGGFEFEQKLYEGHQPISSLFFLICLRKIENREICDIRAFDFFEL